MRSIIYSILLTMLSASLSAQLRAPASSPAATVTQTIGLTDLEVNYYRPSAKGWTIFAADGLVPYGEYWRTGANGATKLSLGDDITLAGQDVKAGDYVVLTKPSSSSWTIYLYTHEGGSWSSYLKKDPVYTLSANSRRAKGYTETFTIAFENLRLDGGDLVLSWADTEVIIPVGVEIQERTMKAINRVLEEPSLGDYFSAATFIHQTGGDLQRALGYVQKVTSSGKGLFFHYYREALILKELGRTSEAKVAAEKSLADAKERDNKDFVRLNEQLLEELR